MTTRLILPERHHQVICRHAMATYPEECCGVLIGSSRREGSDQEMELALVQQVLSIENERQDSRHNRFLITPETVLAAHRQARAAGLDVLGYYHSHPDHPAKPSEYDREHAWPGMSYLIVSVEGGEIADTRSWRLIEDRSRFDEEQLDAGAVAAGASHHAEEVPR